MSFYVFLNENGFSRVRYKNFIENIKYFILYILLNIKLWACSLRQKKVKKPSSENIKGAHSKWQNSKKYLNTITDRVYINRTMGINTHGKQYQRNEGGQLMIIMGITLAVVIILTASIITGLQNMNVDIPRERTQNILPEYLDIRQKFGIALYNNIGPIYTNEQMILSKFNQTRDNFITLEYRYGVFFNAEYKGLTYNVYGEPTGIKAQLIMEYESKKICEEINYDLW